MEHKGNADSQYWLPNSGNLILGLPRVLDLPRYREPPLSSSAPPRTASFQSGSTAYRVLSGHYRVPRLFRRALPQPPSNSLGASEDLRGTAGRRPRPGPEARAAGAGFLAGCWLLAQWLLGGWVAAGWMLAGWLLAGRLAAAGCWLPDWLLTGCFNR